MSPPASLLRVSIIGAGYVGLVTGVSLARSGGHHVTFVERREDRREALAAGKPPIVEPGLEAAMAEVQDRIGVVEDFRESTDRDLVLVAVGTPIGEAGRSDLSQLHAALEDLRQWPDLDISIRSTLPPGVSSRLPSLLGRADGRRISTNPEFLRQGAALADVQRPSRIVIGRFPETTADHLARVHALHAEIDAPRLEVSVAAAELIKNVANSFLALKLSFVNEVASLAEELDVDVDEVLEGIALDPRIGNVYMQPGLGFGGSCLPKELEVVAAAGRRRGLAMHIARAASTVNGEQQDRFARRILHELGRGSHRIALLGLSFKAGTDDLRGSPAAAVARHLVESGMDVVAFDPAVAAAAARREVPGIHVALDAYGAVTGADAVVIGTEWPEFRDLDWATVVRLLRGRLVFDGRNLLDREDVVRHGLSYRGVGRRSADPGPTVPDRSLVPVGTSQD
jgi:UDPglucose 6-dehydrogenase